MSRSTNFSIILLFFFFFLFFHVFLEFSTQEESKKQNYPNIERVSFIHYLDENVAIEEIRSKNLDTYFFRIPLDLVSDIKNDINIKLYEKIGGSFGILLNPSPSLNNDTMNPFAFRDVRFAINFLINRNFPARFFKMNEIIKNQKLRNYKKI